ncbi:unnamed protein product [Echinostoma caproni]|uniref:GPN-loop GTPase 2 n=1 Tax=Echinostoma caproni TaxID=27848 RepID=A0A183BCL6_9TREM|nr:unnamed protein product [Echinostoma caproni]
MWQFFITISGDEKLDLVLYDPIATNAIAYYHCFTPDSLAVLSDLCTKRLKSQGWLLILCEESEKAPPGPSIPSSLGSFQRVLSYLVPESMFADPGTRVDIFHSDALHVNDARVELLTRLQKHKTGCNEQEETFDEIMDMCNHVETLLIDLVHSA